MKLLALLLVASVLAEAQSDEAISGPVSRSVIRDRWSIFGDAKPDSRSAVTSNYIRDKIVTAPAGVVKGFVTRTGWNGIEYNAFLGIPYAKPPVGQLRFMAPVTAQPWTGTYDATYQRPSCLQFEGSDLTESEDCLYINVFTPDTAPSSPIPVMVFIHGGAFISGSSNISIYGPDLLVEKNVVLVTFNYRLGALGFLSFQTEEVPGNAGLKDQVLALKWVQKNIRAFGGDPRRVTIFGESAGAASVSFHMLSPLSKGLFHRAIMQSGTANVPWAYITPKAALNFANRLAAKLKCDKIEDVVRCLRTCRARDIVNEEEGDVTLKDLMAIKPFAFVPTAEPLADGAFFTENPSDALLQNRFNPVPVIIGANSREGLIVLPALKKFDPLGLGIAQLDWDLSVLYPEELRENLTKAEKSIVHKKMKKFYFGYNSVGLFTRGNFLNLITDVSFTMPIQQAAALMANKSENVYSYEFSYDGPYAFYKQQLGLKNEKGVCHGDELGYLFFNGEIHGNGRETSEDGKKMVDVMTELWTNFAKTGNPTPAYSALMKWDRRTLEMHTYMDIGSSLKLQSSVDSTLARRINFWYNLVTNVNG